MEKEWAIACTLVFLAGCVSPAPMRHPVPVAGGILFRLEAPGARQVTLVGTFNDWNPSASPLRAPAGDGIWEVIVPVPRGRHLYMFVVDGEWRTPPDAPHLLDDGFGRRNGLLIVE